MTRARRGFRHITRTITAGVTTAILVALGVMAAPTVEPVRAAGDFQLLVTPADQLLPPGGSVSFLVQVGSLGGFADEVSITVGTLPSGVTHQLSDDAVTPPATVNLTLIASDDAEVGAFPVVVTGTSGALEHVASGSVTVDFGLIPVCHAKVKGTVTDRTTGQPIEGVQIPSFGQVFTNAQGQYAFDKVGLGDNNAPSSFQPMATKDGYWSSFADLAHFVCAQETTVDFTLLPWVAAGAHGRIVEGTVDPGDPDVVLPGQTPIAGIEVSAELTLIPGSGPDTTGADGLFQVSFDHLGTDNTPLGLWLSARESVNFTDEVYWPRGSSTPSPIQVGDIAPGDDLDAGDIGLVRKCFGSINGTLTFGDTDQPAVGVAVTAQHGWWFSSDTTDSTGAYEIPVVSLGYNNQPTDVSVYASDTSGFYQFAEETTHLAACGDAKVVPLTFEPIDLGSLEGRITDEESGAALPGAQVAFRFASCATCDPYPGEANASGDYRIDRIPASEAPPATYNAEANHPGYWWTIHAVGITPGDVTHRDFELLRMKFASLRGRITDAITGEPIEGAQGGATQATGSATTIPDGTYAQTGLEIGYRNDPLPGSVRFSAQGYWPAQAPALFEADQQTVVDLELIPICDGATIRGRVVDATSQQPLEDASVVVSGNGGDLTDADGRYEIGDIQVGDGNSPASVTVVASKDGYFTQSKSITVFCGASISIDFGRTPAHLGALEGFVTHAVTGDPIPNVKIVGAFGQEVTTDGSGHYLFPEVPVGDDGSDKSWDVSALPTGFTHQTKSVTVKANETARLDFEFGSVEPPLSGTIIVDKVAAGGDSAFSFTSQALGDFTITTTGGAGSTTFSDLTPGPFAIAETATPGWDQAGATCSGGDEPASITVEAGETVTCTFTNNKRGSASVHKTVTGAAPAAGQTFAFELRQGASMTAAGTVLGSGNATAANGGAVSFGIALVAGATYQMCEVVMPGWQTSLGPNPFTLFNASGDNSTRCADFTVQPGESRLHAIDNTPPPGGLTRTIGFWKNWSSCSKGKQAPVLDRTLSRAEPGGVPMGRLTLHGQASRPDLAPDCAKAVNLLDKTTIDGKKKSAGDPVFNMAAQLLAAKLNGIAGAGTCAPAATAISQGDALLIAVEFDGLKHARLTAAQATSANALATALDRYNNGLLC